MGELWLMGIKMQSCWKRRKCCPKAKIAMENAGSKRIVGERGVRDLRCSQIDFLKVSDSINARSAVRWTKPLDAYGGHMVSLRMFNISVAPTLDSNRKLEKPEPRAA